MLADPTDRSAAEKALVRTYDHPSYVDPWEAVQDYQRVQRAAADHPEKGSSALSSVVQLPRSRIRSWVDSDGRPDAARALATARDRGWLLESWDDDRASGLVILAAWLLASGGVNRNWQLRFVADGTTEIETLRTAARAANAAVASVRDGDDGRPTEWEPREAASVLGRVLYTWTDVRGDKTAVETRFPEFPQYAPRWVAELFARTYVPLRGTPRSDRPDNRMQLQADRSDRFRRDLVALLERVGNADEIQGDSWPVYLTGDTAATLGALPDGG